MCGVVVSQDGGKSYMPYGSFSIDINEAKTNNEGSVQLWEPNCVEAEDGHIIMYMRDSFRPYINCAESYDYGRTWTHTGNIGIPNANTKISMHKVNGKVLLVSNVNKSLAFDERIQLLIQRSDDNCKTWKRVCYVAEENDRMFYPHVAIDDKNNLLFIAYEDAHKHYINKYSFKELGL